MALPIKPQCETNKITGKYVAVDINWETCNSVDDPETLVFYPLGGMQSKGVDRSQDTEDVTDDRTVGDYRESIGTSKNWSFSGNGIMNHTDSAKSNLVTLDQLYSMPGATYLHVRITEPHMVTYAYVLVTNFSKQWPTDQPITFDLEMVATTSRYGVKVTEPTAYVEPTSLVVSPGEMTLKVGRRGRLSVDVLPEGAARGVIYTSDDTDTATVSPTGMVTAVAVGTANISVTHPDNPALDETSVITVEA